MFGYLVKKAMNFEDFMAVALLEPAAATTGGVRSCPKLSAEEPGNFSCIAQMQRRFAKGRGSTVPFKPATIATRLPVPARAGIDQRATLLPTTDIRHRPRHVGEELAWIPPT